MNTLCLKCGKKLTLSNEIEYCQKCMSNHETLFIMDNEIKKTMNKIAILPLKEMPSSCSECGLKVVNNKGRIMCSANKKLKINNPYSNIPNQLSHKCSTSKHPNCPLISIDIDELEFNRDDLIIIRGALNVAKQHYPNRTKMSNKVIDKLDKIFKRSEVR